MAKEKRVYKYLCMIAAVIGVLLLVKLGISSKLENPYISMPAAQELDSGWYYMEGEKKIEVTLPFAAPGGGMTFYYDLPDMGEQEQVLLFDNDRQKVTVWLDGRMVYHFGTEGAHWGRALPDIYCAVPVGVQNGTHQVAVRLEEGIGGRTVFHSVKAGSDGEILGTVVGKLSGVMLFSVIMISFALIMMVIAGVILLKRGEGMGELFLHAGIFIFIISLWVLTDEPFFQLMTGSVEAVFTLSFLCFMLIPLPMLSFVQCICERGYKGILAFKYLILTNFLVQNLFHAGLGIDYFVMLPLTHAFIGGAIFCMIYYLYREYREKKAFYAKGILGAILIFLVCTAFALLDFYGEQKYYSRWIRVGILVYSVVLIALSIKKMLIMEEERAKNVIYKSLAFVDLMTGCGNRAAFEMLLRDRKMDQTEETICLAIVDVNGLKHTNDTMGHLSGDEIIKGAAYCLQEAFWGMGEVFRIGGDEFAVLFRGCREDEGALRKRLEKSLQSYNSAHGIPVSLACGIAAGTFEKDEIDSRIERLYHDADQRMYEEKRESPYCREDGDC